MYKSLNITTSCCLKYSFGPQEILQRTQMNWKWFFNQPITWTGTNVIKSQLIKFLFGCSGSKNGLPFLPGASPPFGPPPCSPSGLSQHLRKPLWCSAGPGCSQRSCHVLCHADSSNITRGGSDWLDWEMHDAQNKTHSSALHIDSIVLLVSHRLPACSEVAQVIFYVRWLQL